jgi:hypothetical protein
MINKLISNLSFNPGTVDQIGFYSKRLKREESIRRLGLVMVALSMIVQIMAATFPAEKSLAYSDNHIINGVKTKSDILRAWDNPRSDVSRIYGKFGVTRKDIADLPNKPNASIRSNENNFWSIGRNSLSGYSNIDKNYKDQEVAMNAAGTPIYLRPLKAWDASGTASTYKAFRGKNSTTGETFWIIADCGNYTQIGRGQPVNPSLQIKKSVLGNPATVKPGDKIQFKIEFRNQRHDSLAENVRLIDHLDRSKYDPVTEKTSLRNSGKTIEKDLGNLQFTSHSKVFSFEVRVKNNLNDIHRLCNQVRLTSSNAPSVSDKTCVSLQSSTQAKKTQPEAVKAESPKPIDQRSQPVPQSTTEIPPGFSKDIKNITRNLSGEKATEFSVRPGDVIEYSLSTTNSGSSDIENYTVADYVGDLNDYAEIQTDFLVSQGGTYDSESKEILWQNVTLPANSEIVKKFRIRIKDQIPSTNSPSNLTTNFDCKISNEYGDEVTLDVECPWVKNVETLPNTGPGATIGFTFATTMLSGYFFARSRLFSKELSIAKRIFPSSRGSL